MKLSVGAIVPVKDLTPGSFIDYGAYRYRILKAELVYQTKHRVFAYEEHKFEHKFELTSFDAVRLVKITNEVTMASTGARIYYSTFDKFAVAN